LRVLGVLLGILVHRVRGLPRPPLRTHATAGGVVKCPWTHTVISRATMLMAVETGVLRRMVASGTAPARWPSAQSLGSAKLSASTSTGVTFPSFPRSAASLVSPDFAIPKISGVTRPTMVANSRLTSVMCESPVLDFLQALNAGVLYFEQGVDPPHPPSNYRHLDQGRQGEPRQHHHRVRVHLRSTREASPPTGSRGRSTAPAAGPSPLLPASGDKAVGGTPCAW